VYDFARDLPAGIAYRFRLRAGLQTLAGRAVTGPTDFAFSTGGRTSRRGR
jgi:alpha-2-macroglobulin